VFGGDGMNRVGGGRRVNGAALLLCGGRQAARQNQRDYRKYPKYPVSFDCKKGHQKSAAS